MKHVVFVAPFLMDTTLRFVRAAAAHPDSSTSLVTQEPSARLPEDLRRLLDGHYRVDDALDPQQIETAVRALGESRGPVDLLLGTLEQLQVPLAHVRERLGLPGMGVEAAVNFRDKAQMKDALRRAGLPCARHQRITRPDDAWAFIQRVGYPVIVKPPAGAGARGTHQVDDATAMDQLLASTPPSERRPLLAEEMIRGSEHSFDAVVIDGRVVWSSITHYRPNPLEVVRQPWIQWCILLPREVDDPQFDDIRAAAAKALAVLGLETGVCHLEWFRRGDGSIAISEVGARPGGAQISKLISYAHDVDFYKAWARVMIDRAFDPPRREYAAGAAFLRGQGRGRVERVRGLEAANRELGPLVVESNLPRLGQPASGSYEGEGYVILRHRQTRTVEQALQRLITLVRVEMG